MSDHGENIEWEARADVLYHFYAYHFFDKLYPSVSSLNLINLNDADIQYYNRTADMVHGLSTSYKLAKYLQAAEHLYHEDPSPSANTMRKRLIDHIHKYNMKLEPRRRFYLLGLVNEDKEFFDQVNNEQLSKGRGVKDSDKINWASDCCFQDAKGGDEVFELDVVCKAVKEKLAASELLVKERNGVDNGHLGFESEEYETKL